MVSRDSPRFRCSGRAIRRSSARSSNASQDLGSSPRPIEGVCSIT
nr:MAG TPA: hypothetical protein [Caudoviricetes sp.]